VYLDAGNPGWIAADTIAQWLDGAGLRTVRGFAVNTTNFYTTTESTTYATAIGAALQARYGYIARFVVDTSRNGNGALDGVYCNPAGRRLGAPADVVEEPRPGNTPRSRMADLLLWLKTPGDSDGRCGTAPDTDAGVFDPVLATNLIAGT
jgi:endoglucanase